MKPNPLIELADADRHKRDSCADQFCLACGAHASTYNANHSLIQQRPEAEGWDWWVACNNADCMHAYGEGLFQDPLDWIEKKHAT